QEEAQGFLQLCGCSVLAEDYEKVNCKAENQADQELAQQQERFCEEHFPQVRGKKAVFLQYKYALSLFMGKEQRVVRQCQADAQADEIEQETELDGFREIV